MLANRVDVDQTKSIFDIVGVCMSCFSIFVVIFNIFKKAPLVVKESWKEDENEPKKKKGFIMRLIKFIFKLLKTAFKLLSNFQLLYYIAYGATALIGALYHEFFFTFHMTEILVRYYTINYSFTIINSENHILSKLFGNLKNNCF